MGRLSKLETVHVPGASPGAAVANLVLDAAHLEDVDLAGARLPRLARMPYVDVLAAAGTLARALGIRSYATTSPQGKLLFSARSSASRWCRPRLRRPRG